MKRPGLWKQAVLCCFALIFAPNAHAVEYSVSGFGTVGGAISDNSTTMQRFINDKGTFSRDSLLGVQLDAKFNEKWSATTQVIVAPRVDEDTGVAPQLKWTLLSYRPSNDWLIRVGRLSLGGLLNQQNMDVGVSYDMARLPNEVYLLSSSYDFDGISLAKTWNASQFDITLDGSFGFQKRDLRSYGNGSQTQRYYSADVSGGALVLTVSDLDRTMYRLGWDMMYVKPVAAGGFLSKYTFTQLPGGLYTLGMPQYTSGAFFHSFFLGGRFPVGDFMVSSECTAVIPENVEPAPPSISAYVSLSYKWNKWTPYLTYAQMWTSGMDTWRKVQGATPIPQLGITQAAIDDAASLMAVYEQNSWMLGTSYAISPKQKLKAEAMLTHVGERSAMFDGPIAHENVMVYSLSYNFSF
ncbi:MAG: hypothetical protein P4L42_14980 [Desulfocapsaceae bacterium]|nr:hypothetical protein [Desulfocapsaceae bacterium]